MRSRKKHHYLKQIIPLTMLKDERADRSVGINKAFGRVDRGLVNSYDLKHNIDRN